MDDSRHPATSEAEWAARLDALPGLDLPSDQRVVVVAPHPDDETLAFGGTLQALAANNCAVEIALCTDGEASHPGVPGLAGRRWAELRHALVCLGLDRVPVHRLGLGDGRLAEQREALAERLLPILRRADLCAGPIESDGHPDHEAASWAVTEAAARLEMRPRRWWYPVWAWHWMDPADAPFLESARRLELAPGVSARKHDAIRCFTSQITAIEGRTILPPPVTAHFLRPFETIVVEPDVESRPA